MGAHDWTNIGRGCAPSFRRSAQEVVDYLQDSNGLALDPKLVLDLFDNKASANDQLARTKEILEAQLRDRADAGRPVNDVLLYYIGHGDTDDQGHLSLLVRRSSRGLEADTGIRAPALANMLRRAAPQQRRFVILDCCFSEAAARAFIGMSGNLDQQVVAMAAKDFRDDQPMHGTILLCSSPVGDVSFGPPNAERTLFTGAVIEVLRQGVEGRPNFLSFADLRHAASERMRVSFGANAPQPVLHQVNASHGDLTHAPAFPNRILANISGRFGHLVSFLKDHGIVQVRRGCKVEGMDLGRWVIHQRELYRQGALTTEQSSRLEQLPGWSWNSIADQFERGFAILRHFVAEHRHARVPRDTRVDGFPLGAWVTERRAAYKKKTMSAEQIRRFETLKGWVWDPRADAFEKWFVLLEDFVAATGHAASDYKIGKMSLGRWVVKQRQSYNQQRMPRSKSERLQALKGWSWDLAEDAFDTQFSLLERYVASHGDALVPQQYRNGGIRLGGWVNERRLDTGKTGFPRKRSGGSSN